MPKSRRLELLIAVGLAILVLLDLVYAVQLSSYEVNPTYQSAAQQQKQTSGQSAVLTGASFFLARLADFLVKYNAAITAIATVGLVIFTFTLWRATSGLLRAAEKQAADTSNQIRISGESADAAKASAEAASASVQVAQSQFIATHRPEIRIKHVYIASEIWGEKPIEVKLVIVNCGLTPATILQMNIETMILSSVKRLPPRPNFSEPNKAIQEPELRSGMTLALKKWTVFKAITHDEHSNLRSGNRKLYCYGFVEYMDLDQRIRKTAFCRVWEPAVGPGGNSEPGRLVRVEDPDYEYQD